MIKKTTRTISWGGKFITKYEFKDGSSVVHIYSGIKLIKSYIRENGSFRIVVPV